MLRVLTVLSLLSFSLSARAGVPASPATTLQEAVENPYNKYFTSQDITEIDRKQSRLMKGQVLLVDTRDQRACAEVQKSLMTSSSLIATNDPRTLCVQDPERPLASVLILRPSDENEWQREINLSRWTSDQKNLFTETRNVSLAAVGVAGVLYLMPTSVSNWDRQKMKHPAKSYKDNVKNGPVIDHDSWAINFIGHPYSGAAYYQVARHAGMEPMRAFGYSVLMSTFFWEFGVEAVAEAPSIQDLFITPIVGSLMGELFYRTEQKIRANKGRVLGSETLGSVIIVAMNPMGALGEQINKIFGSKVVQDARARWVARKGVHTGPGAHNDPIASPYWGLEVQFKF